MIKVYHNPRCKKSRAGLEHLKTITADFIIVKYLNEAPFTKERLNDLIKKTGKEPEDLIRTQEKIYREKYKGRNLKREEWIEAMVEHPKLISRPIVEKDRQAVLGDPPSEIDKLF